MKITDRFTTRFLFALSILSIGAACSNQAEDSDAIVLSADRVLMEMADRIDRAIEEAEAPRLPRSVEEGKVRYTSPEGWTSGFLPGMLWMLQEYDTTRDWTTSARKYTELLEEVQHLTSHHDLGFMLYGSYGKGYKRVSDKSYREVLVNGANSLASRYDSLVGMIKSWDRPGKWQYPVIIDNMMNLEYLFWATKETGDSTYFDMAYSHAIRTLQDHYRKDNSSYHVVDYDTLSGEPIWKGTHQGLADESIWARGQAWGLYGFTMAYRETGDEAFLARAMAVAKYLMHHEQMPADKVPYWDLQDPEIPNAPRDASAAAIIASGLLELSEYDAENGEEYINYATDILRNLSKDYRFEKDAKSSFFYLDQSVGNKPKNSEVSIPIIYADYYFMEALLRLKEIEAES